MLVTVPELREYLSGITLGEHQMDAAAQVLAGVQRELEYYLGRPVERRQFTERARVQPDGTIVVKNTPVYAVLAVNPSTMNALTEIDYGEDGFPENVTDPVTGLTDHNDVPGDLVGGSVLPGGFIGPYGQGYGTYVVTYIGGYDGRQDEGVKTSILRVAAREIAENHDDTVSASADVAQRPVYGKPKGWQMDELLNLERLRRRMVV